MGGILKRKLFGHPVCHFVIISIVKHLSTHQSGCSQICVYVRTIIIHSSNLLHMFTNQLPDNNSTHSSVLFPVLNIGGSFLTVLSSLFFYIHAHLKLLECGEEFSVHFLSMLCLIHVSWLWPQIFETPLDPRLLLTPCLLTK